MSKTTSRVPPCASPRRHHSWRPANVGCAENPGVLGAGGNRLAILHTCPHCSVTRREANYTDRHGDTHGWRVTYAAAE